MRVVSTKYERKFVTKRGTVDVCDTVRQYVNEHGDVMLQTVIRTEFQAPWLSEAMAKELWDWMHYGFQGPPPDWAI